MGILCAMRRDTWEICIGEFCVEEIDSRVSNMDHKCLICKQIFPQGKVDWRRGTGQRRYLLILVVQGFKVFGMAYLSEHFSKDLCSVTICGSLVIFFGVLFAFRLECSAGGDNMGRTSTDKTTRWDSWLDGSQRMAMDTPPSSIAVTRCALPRRTCMVVLALNQLIDGYGVVLGEKDRVSFRNHPSSTFYPWGYDKEGCFQEFGCKVIHIGFPLWLRRRIGPAGPTRETTILRHSCLSGRSGIYHWSSTHWTADTCKKSS